MSDPERKNANVPKDSKDAKEQKKEVQKGDFERKMDSVKKANVSREIVRISGVDLNGNLRIDRALTNIKGIGIRSAKVLSFDFCKKVNLPQNTLLGNIPAENDEILSDIVSKCELPFWMTNRQRDIYSGESKHLIGSDLLFNVREDKQRLNRIKSRRGMRLQAGLPVRGQKTRSNFRRRQGAVGVIKKTQMPGKAAPRAQAKPEKKDNKK